MGDAIKVLSNQDAYSTMGQTPNACNLQQMERQTIAFLYELWRLQGVTNKKIVTVKR